MLRRHPGAEKIAQTSNSCVDLTFLLPFKSDKAATLLRRVSVWAFGCDWCCQEVDFLPPTKSLCNNSTTTPKSYCSLKFCFVRGSNLAGGLSIGPYRHPPTFPSRCAQMMSIWLLSITAVQPHEPISQTYSSVPWVFFSCLKKPLSDVVITPYRTVQLILNTCQLSSACG